MKGELDRRAIERIARSFDARRARKNIAAIWREAVGQDTPAVWRAARAAASRLRQVGVTDVRIEGIPADGRTAVGGWLMPVAWTATAARLETIEPCQLLADTAVTPLALALYSPPTPPGATVVGGVLPVPETESDDDARLAFLKRKAREISGRFVLVGAVKPAIELNVYAASRGALGIVAIHPGPAPRATRYLNYAVPLDEGRPCVPVFSLTVEAGATLRKHLQSAGGHAQLRARVQSRRYAGTVPLVTGTLGEGRPAVYLCGHIDEIGAQDNASGCGVAIEALRVLRTHVASQRRQIRFYFSSEVRGMQWWFNNKERPSFVGGINLDMVGAAPAESAVVQVFRGFRHRPHFAAECLQEAVRLAEDAVGRKPTELRFNYVTDGHPGLGTAGGHVSLEQKTGPTYHSSADTPRILNATSLRWSGVATTAFLYTMTRMDNADVLRLARQFHRRAADAKKQASQGPEADPVRLAAQARSLRAVFRIPQLHPDLATPEEFYRAGVNRTTGLWPELELKAKFDALLASWAGNATGGVGQAPDQNPLVPIALFNGFLSFEDHTDPREIAAIWRRCELKPGWGTQSWAWILPSCFTGKQSLGEILASLRRLGVEIDPVKARELTLYLAKRGLVRLRPVFTQQSFAEALRRAGVRRGSVLMVHSSLSRFGYVSGGPATVVAALREVLGPSGTLAMPTHSNSVLGVAPYRPADSPSNTGAITEYFRKLPGVLRSAHPTHSVAACGPLAERLVGGISPDSPPLAREGFWGRLYDQDGNVLMLCRLRSATIFHTGETWLKLPQRNLIAHSLDANGQRRVHVMPNAPWHVDHFDKTMAQPLIRRGVMKVTRIGDDDAYLAPARAMVDMSLRVLRRNHALALGKDGACVCTHCTALRRGLANDAGRG